MSQADSLVKVSAIASGKLRRYHNLSVWRQLLRFRTIVLPNILDSVKIAIGFFESLVRLVMWRPDVVFAKGGFVCLPVGVAAFVLKIPIVIHDSDAVPGLTNRILSRLAVAIGTGAPLEYYNYPKGKAHYVGIPVNNEIFKKYSAEERQKMKRQLGFTGDRPLLVVTGGGLGAHRLNMAIVGVFKKMVELMDIILVTGKADFESISGLLPAGDGRVQVYSFVSSDIMALTLGASDIVVARAGATTIAELSAMAKPTILVPNKFLTSGHQVKNAQVYSDKQAVRVIDEIELEESPDTLYQEIQGLLSDLEELKSMGRRLESFSKPKAARDMAELIYKSL